MRLTSSPSQHLKAWAVKVDPGHLHVLLINKRPKPVAIHMDLPASTPAAVERLLAPAASSLTGVTLGGQWLDYNGNWVGKPVRERVAPTGHRYLVALPRYSAAYVRVPLTPRSLG